jgi:malate dehydrogenase
MAFLHASCLEVSNSIKLEGEFGINNCYLGVPVVLGKNGVERIFEISLNEAELALLKDSEKAVKGVMEVLDKQIAATA